MPADEKCTNNPAALRNSIASDSEDCSVPKGSRVVATGGASRGRNPVTRDLWNRCCIMDHAAPEGRRKSAY